MINNPYKILNAYFIETGTAPDMVSRNLMTHITEDAVHQFDYRTASGSNLTPDNLAGIAGGIIISDPNSERLVQMVNGWNNRRLRFVIRVGIPGQVNGILYYYTGYTDFNGWSSQVKNFDRNMRMYINNVLQVSNAQRMTPQGPVPFVQVVECTHLLHPSNLGTTPGLMQTQFDPTNMNVMNQPSTLRPYDLMNNLAITTRQQQQMQYGGMPIIDTRPSIDLVKSNRMNSVPSQYLSKSIEALSRGVHEAADNMHSATPTTAFETAAGRVIEVNPFSDRFLHPLIVEYGLQQNGFVTWGQMEAIHPEVHSDGVTRVNTSGVMQAGSVDMYVADGSNYDTMVGDRRASTDFYNRAIAALPSVLLPSLVVFARIHVTNMTLDGSMQVTITDPLSFVDIPPGFLIDRIPLMQERIKSLIFQDLGLNYHVPFDATFTIDNFGESFGLVSFNGEPHVPYVTPSYADAMLTQLVTPNGGVLTQMANDINYLVSSVI